MINDNHCFFFSVLQPLVLVVPVIVDAALIGGETTHSALYLNKESELEPEEVELWEETRMLIVDEISFAYRDLIVKVDANLKVLKQSWRTRYGGINVVFSGDFRQMEPIRAAPIYAEECEPFENWTNCFIELTGTHRSFKDDPEWGMLLRRFRNGEVTKEDIEKINKRVVSSDTALPGNLRYATYYNHDRDAINAGLFEKRCRERFAKVGNTKDSLIIFSDELQVKNSSGKYVQFPCPKKYWEEWGENDVDVTTHGSNRLDPVLKLYEGCPIMLPCNSNVKLGQANGTQASVVHVHLKPGVEAMTVELSGGIPVAAVLASQVSHVELRHCNDRIRPPVFCVHAKQYSFIAHTEKRKELQTKKSKCEKLHMKCLQLPILVNNATTGHKLQGTGVDNLFVHSWSYTTNWAYVMLSRVKTYSGLFMRNALEYDPEKFAVPKALKKMLEKLALKQPTYWTPEEYQKKFS